MARAVDDVPGTSHFDFLAGAFRLSPKWSIPYLTTTLSLEEAARDLRLTAEMPGIDTIAWKIDELYQRNINWPRVERQIVPYLRNNERPQFFNSITVALLPFDDTNTSLVSSFSAPDVAWKAPKLNDPHRYERVLEVGPLALGFWDSWEEPSDVGFRSGQLRWNTRQVFGVAIDGQHRLAAIKSFTQGNTSPGVTNTRVPVIFLLFDPQLGFSGPAEEADLVPLLRSLFIDLNKNAQTVNRARQILLDDRDPHAASVRRVVGTGLSAGLQELAELPPRLPLSLVDWHSEKAKFDDGPYLTTVLGLDGIVSRILDTKPIGDFTDYAAVRRQLKVLQDRLACSLNAAQQRVTDLETMRLSPFTYSDEELDLVEDRFAALWSQPTVHILTKFRPYSELIAKRLSGETLMLEFQHWFELFERQRDDPFEGRATQEYRQYLGQLSNRDVPIAEAQFKHKLDELNALKRDNLAFNVVFQRAMFDAFLAYVKFSDQQMLELTSDEEHEEPDFDDAPLEEDDDVEDSFMQTDDEVEVNETVASVAAVPTAAQENTLQRRHRQRAEEFIAALNHVEASCDNLLRLNGHLLTATGEAVSLWQGSLLKAEGGIDFTQAAAGRAKELLLLIAIMHAVHARDASRSFDEFWLEVDDDQAPHIVRSAGRAIRRCTRPGHIAERILLVKEADIGDEEALASEIFDRLQPLWTALGAAL